MKSIFIVILVFLNLNLIAQIPTTGLVGAWTFNGNANDVSGNGNNGTVYGATLITDRCGNANSAYSFNGTSNYIQMLNAGPTGTVSRSVSFWAKTSATNLMTTFAYGNSSGGLAYAIQHNYNCSGVGVDVNNQALTRGGACVLNNGWHHIVAILNSSVGIQLSNVQFYLDGVLLPSITCVITGSTQTINTGSNFPIAIGRIHDASARFFNGALDDFYLYNRVLSPSEVQQLFTACSISILGPSSICPSTTGTYSINPIGNNVSYTWTLPNGWTGSSNTNSITLTSNSNPGAISVSANLGCGGVVSSSLNIALSGTANVNINVGNTASVCSGSSLFLSASGANTYTWFPGNISGSGILVTPTVSTVYTISGSSSACAVLDATVSVVVAPIPTLNATSQSGSVCAGGPVVLSALGANSYTWYPGGISTNPYTVSPFASMSFTVTGQNAAGCQSSSTLGIMVVQGPPLSIALTSSTICKGKTIVLTANGASSYTWLPGNATTSAVTVNPNVTTTYTLSAINEYGCQSTATQQIKVSDCTEIRQLENYSDEIAVRVFPNPSNGFVTLQLMEDSQILLLDLLGRQLMKQGMIAGEYELNLSQYPRGVYFLKTTFGNQMKVTKLVKD